MFWSVDVNKMEYRLQCGYCVLISEAVLEPGDVDVLIRVVYIWIIMSKHMFSFKHKNFIVHY